MLHSTQGHAKTILSAEGIEAMYRGRSCDRTDDNPYNLYRRPKLFLSEPRDLRSLEELLAGLARTVTNCTHNLLPGFYHDENVFLYHLQQQQQQQQQQSNANNNTSSNMLMRDRIMSDWMVRRHRHVAVWQPFERRRQLFSMTRYNIYARRSVSVSWDMRAMMNGMRKGDGIEDVLFPYFPMKVRKSESLGKVCTFHQCFLYSY